MTPSLAEFQRLAGHGNVIPVFAEFVADAETPVSAFLKLNRRGGYGFLFESTEKNDVSGRFSFVGVEPRLVITSHGSEICVRENGAEQRNQTNDPLRELERLMARYRFAASGEWPRF